MRSTCHTQSRDCNAIDRQVAALLPTLDGIMYFAFAVRFDESAASARGQVAFENR